ncbi:hypothetical protein HMPREF0058_0014 [Actinomyces urogenitalis DSM 15434]|uniref:Uncharacterized protein n=1 Tax=Actinomyces urogenitalis DSM 15434 TaxID=525246 RepID=C0W2C0_9ACTO|nr:hypothetical protein [Actinomyces urogenitalis]EEH67114.1 hypothetical protein HMPREF0058_0014 [Actinomyces urogenitalis DSM 15434]
MDPVRTVRNAQTTARLAFAQRRAQIDALARLHAEIPTDTNQLNPDQLDAYTAELLDIATSYALHTEPGTACLNPTPLP